MKPDQDVHLLAKQSSKRQELRLLLRLIDAPLQALFLCARVHAAAMHPLSATLLPLLLPLVANELAKDVVRPTLRAIIAASFTNTSVCAIPLHM